MQAFCFYASQGLAHQVSLRLTSTHFRRQFFLYNELGDFFWMDLADPILKSNENELKRCFYWRSAQAMALAVHRVASCSQAPKHDGWGAESTLQDQGRQPCKDATRSSMLSSRGCKVWQSLSPLSSTMIQLAAQLRWQAKWKQKKKTNGSDAKKKGASNAFHAAPLNDNIHCPVHGGHKWGWLHS